MKQALLALEKGLYDESLNDVITASRLLASVANPALTRRELRLCVAYALALRMLRRLKELDRSAALTDAALLSKYPLGQMRREGEERERRGRGEGEEREEREREREREEGERREKRASGGRGGKGLI